MKASVERHDDGSLTLTLRLSEAEALELETPLHDEEPVHPSLSDGAREYCVTCTEGFHRGRRTRVRADTAALAALQALAICQAGFTVGPLPRAGRDAVEPRA
jgi:hypothetical protein